MKTQTARKTLSRLGQAIAILCVMAQPSWADQAISYTYTDQGQILTEDGPRTDVQDITSHTYNTDGTRATSTNAAGHLTRYNTYDGAGRLTSVTDPNGVTTDLTYHPRGWLESVTVKHPTDASLNATTTYGYDEVGQLTQTTAPDGQITHFEYTDARQLKAVRNNAGERIDYELDDAGNRKNQQIKNASGSITYSLARTYDELSRVMDITGNNGQNSHIQYDLNNNPKSQTNAKQHSTQQQFDALDRVKKVIDPALKETHYTYDAQGNIQTVTDARGNTTRYDYDAFGNLKTLTSPDTGVTQYTYDEAGNLKTRLDADGRRAEYQYDALNRITQITYPASPQENVSFQYDSQDDIYLGTDWGRGYGIGRLSGRTDAAGTHTYGYDYQGRLASQSTVFEDTSQAYSSDLSLAYHYDLAGKITRIFYPSNRVVNYSYNTQGRVAHITTQSNSSAAPQTLFSEGEYLPFGPLTAYRFGNGIQARYTYDTDYRLQSIQTQGPFAVLDQMFGYDLTDNLNSWNNTLNPSQNQAFDYDPQGRLKTAQSNYGSIGFSYDEVGNRLQKTLNLNGTTEEDTYQIAPDSNRLEAITTRINGQDSNSSHYIGYDAAGNSLYGPNNENLE
ncbi:MAG: hypothetical protein RL497_1539 [Pseudomonadota bacterium]|jgi:YD repeat-containing protein